MEKLKKKHPKQNNLPPTKQAPPHKTKPTLPNQRKLRTWKYKLGMLPGQHLGGGSRRNVRLKSFWAAQ